MMSRGLDKSLPFLNDQQFLVKQDYESDALSTHHI